MPNQPPARALRFEGALVVANAPDICKRLLTALDGEGSVDIDLSSATEMDVSFLQLLVAAKKTADTEMKTLAIRTGDSKLLATQMHRCGVADDAIPPVFS